jgi:branched-chain amino acid transport system permease protein
MLTAFAIATDGLVYAAYLFLVAVGLSLIFGVMKILNVTHGSFYAFGAYGAAVAVGMYFDRGLPAAGGFLLMVLVAAAVGLVLGLILERGLLRLFYGKDEIIVVLVTYAAFLILEDVIRLVFGATSYTLYQPLGAAGTLDVGTFVLSGYDILLVALATLVALGASIALKYTRWGHLLTVVIFDRELAAAVGINVSAVYTITFIAGAMLGALGGAAMAPKIAVTLGIGVEVIVLAFAVVAIGGMGSIGGAFVSALIVGECRAAAVHLAPQVELFVVYAVMALVLIFRPQGLFTRAQPRKI